MFKTPLARDVAKLLAFKMLALGALYFAFFAPSHRPRIDPRYPFGAADLARHSDLKQR